MQQKTTLCKSFAYPRMVLKWYTAMNGSDEPELPQKGIRSAERGGNINGTQSMYMWSQNTLNNVAQMTVGKTSFRPACTSPERHACIMRESVLHVAFRCVESNDSDGSVLVFEVLSGVHRQQKPSAYYSIRRI